MDDFEQARPVAERGQIDAPAEETTFRLEEFATDSSGPDPREKREPVDAPPVPRLDPYSDREVAELAATLSAFGLDLDAMDAYTAAYIAKALPILTVLEMGDALAECGIHKGGGISQAPAWVRAAAGGAGLAFVTVSLRRQFSNHRGAWGSKPGEGGTDEDMADRGATDDSAPFDFEGAGFSDDA